jgi:Protein of unknown function (DUF1593)
MSRARVFISTDLRLSSEEKDDAQSLIHALLYQDKIDIVGIAGTASKWGHQNGRVSDIDKIIDVYGQDYAKLAPKSSGFKTAAELKAISHQGAVATAPSAGYSKATASSKAIIAEAQKAAAAGETLNVLTWGGETDLAQALHDDPSIAPHIRFFNIDKQDPNAHNYIAQNFKGELDMWVDNQSTFRGMHNTPEGRSLIKGWHEANAKGHGALGDYFAKLSGDIFNVSGVKMGDSPTVLRFLTGNQNDPTQESWGGEFRKVSEGYYTDKTDGDLAFGWGNTKGAMTIYEDRAAWLKSFAERLDWLKGGEPQEPTETAVEPQPQPNEAPDGKPETEAPVEQGGSGSQPGTLTPEPVRFSVTGGQTVEEGGVLSFTLTRSEPAAETHRINLALKGSADPAGDYEQPLLNVQFLKGEIQKLVQIRTKLDVSVEANESVILSLPNGETAEGIIADQKTSKSDDDQEIDAVMTQFAQTVAGTNRFDHADFVQKDAYEAFGMVSQHLPTEAATLLAQPAFEAQEATQWYKSFIPSSNAVDLF